MIPEYKKYYLSRLVTVREIVSADYVHGPFPNDDPHAHEDAWELVYSVNGNVQFLVDSEMKSLNSFEFALIRPNVIHNISLASAGDQAFVIAFTCTNSDNFRLFFDRTFHADSTARMLFSHIIGELASAFHSNHETLHLTNFESNISAPFGAEQMVCNYLEQILILQIRALTLSQVTPDDSRYIRSALHAFAVNEVTTYITEHLREPLTVEMIARHFHYSRSRLSLLYKNATGMGIRETIIQKRLDYARTLLDDGDKSISEIAEYLGFSSPQYFSQMFTKRIGCTPSEYAPTK